MGLIKSRILEGSGWVWMDMGGRVEFWGALGRAGLSLEGVGLRCVLFMSCAVQRLRA